MNARQDTNKRKAIVRMYRSGSTGPYLSPNPVPGLPMGGKSLFATHPTLGEPGKPVAAAYQYWPITLFSGSSQEHIVSYCGLVQLSVLSFLSH